MRQEVLAAAALGGMFGGLFKGGQANQLGMAAGGIALMQSLGQKGVMAQLSGIGGGGTMGYNFSKLAASNSTLQGIFPYAGGTGGMIAGTAAGAGLGLFTQGLTKSGWGGWGETVAGGATTGGGHWLHDGRPHGCAPRRRNRRWCRCARRPV
jgi:hypothetical protein